MPNTEGWKPLKSGNTASGWLTAAFNPVKATHIKFNTNDKELQEVNNGKNRNIFKLHRVYTSVHCSVRYDIWIAMTLSEEVADMGEVEPCNRL